ncbi:MAG: ABC transporter permease [Sulfolobales archaeon]
MSSTARFFASNLVNAFLVVFLTVLIASIAFNFVHEKESWGRVYETVESEVRRFIIENPRATPEDVENYKRFRESYWISFYGLDQPVAYRILVATYKTLMLDFGDARILYTAYGHTKDVRSIVLTAMGRTALLFTTATLLNIVFGILFGVLIASKAGSTLDKVSGILAMITNAMPLYWFGAIMIWFFAYRLNLFPAASWRPIPPYVAENPIELIKWFAWHMFIPIISMFVLGVFGWAWSIRAVVVEKYSEDFVMVLRAKGLPERYIRYKHVLRAAAPPVVTMATLSITGSLFGAIVSEVLFQWPGMGMLYYTALRNSDTIVVLADTYAFVVLFVAAKLILDLVYGLLDPRIRIKR